MKLRIQRMVEMGKENSHHREEGRATGMNRYFTGLKMQIQNKYQQMDKLNCKVAPEYRTDLDTRVLVLTSAQLDELCGEKSCASRREDDAGRVESESKIARGNVVNPYLGQS